jgi:ABC-type phosphate transport system substrate-binding protein
MAANGGSRRGRERRLAALLAALVVAAGMLSVFASSAGAAQGFVPISGSGSTWSLNALDQWRRNVAGLYGITVNFAPNGSTSGRNDFRAGQVDFAVSEIPYGLSDGGVLDPLPGRAFGYMPIVAGGTSFMYNLKIGNTRVSNLRLSGDTITKIFTQQITNWSDPAIKADNPGLALPARKIVPVVYSNGSGTTAQFTTWMANQYGPQWDDYCHRNGRALTPCGFTSFFPAPGWRPRHSRREYPGSSPRTPARAPSPTSSTPMPATRASRWSRCSTRRTTTSSPRRAASPSRCSTQKSAQI